MESRGRPREGPEARLSSKRQAKTRRPRGHKVERKAVISPSLSNKSAYALAVCLPFNTTTVWRGAVDPERALKLGSIARGRPRLGVPEGRKRREKL